MRPQLGVRSRALRERLEIADGFRGKAQAILATLRGRTGGDGTTPVPLRVKPGHTIWVRPRSTDLMNVSDYLSLELYLPPPEMRNRELRHLVELGTNMGACMTGLALRYPNAQIVGVEPDADNFAVAAKNAATFGSRATVVHAAIWEREADLVVTDAGKGEHGMTVRERVRDDPPELQSTRGLPIAALIAEHVPDDAEVDYMHVSMEGAEPTAFETPGWPGRVRSLRVEAHPYFGYDAPACIAQLERLGYRAWAAPELPDKWVFAVRA